MTEVRNELAPYAATAAHSRGRRHPEPPPALRTEFQRDRDRIIHSTAFRRLGQIEVAEIAQQRAKRLGTRRGQCGIDPGEIGHVLTLPGRNTLSGRISNAPPAELLARARSRAVSTASSSVEQSTT